MATRKIKANHVFFRNVKWCGCSRNGNSKYYAEMILQDGARLCGKTATDGIGGVLKNYEAYMKLIRKKFDGELWYREVEVVNKYAYCEYHITAHGNVIFDLVMDEEQYESSLNPIVVSKKGA